jgi:hypothetical protein
MNKYLKSLVFAACIPVAALQAADGDFTVGTIGFDPDVNNWPGGEAPALALDGDSGTKYLNFAKFFTGFIVTLPSSAAVDSIAFTSANDAPERNPATFSLYGSNSVSITGSESPGTIINIIGTFDAIAENVSTGFTSSTPAFTSNTVGVSNTTGYTTYLLVFPTVADASAENSMQIGDSILRAGGSPVVSGSTPVVGGVLTPVPEPGSALAACLGAAGLFGVIRRRR